MKEEDILRYMINYFCKELGDEDDLMMALEALNESGSLGYFYYITKEFERILNETYEIDEDRYQTILAKWFHHSVENLTFITL